MAIHKLTQKLIRSLGDGLHSDGGNLYLRVRGNARSWVYRFRYHDKLTDLGLGSLSTTPLNKAREKAAALRESIANGGNPVYSRAAQRHQIKAQAKLAKRTYLPDIIDDALTHTQRLKRAKAKEWLSSRRAAYFNHADSIIGAIPIDLITKHDIKRVLDPLWEDHNAIALLVLATIRHCYSYAIANGLFKGTPPTEWRNNLETVMPVKPKSTKHHASCPWEKIPEVFKTLFEVSSVNADLKNCLLATILCGTRIGEFGRMDAADVDHNKRLAIVRHRKDKNPEPFVVPYPRQAEHFFMKKEGPAFTNRVGKPIDSRSFLGFLNRRFPEYTVHGFRATFSTWCAENGKDPYVRELCLCHEVDNAVAAAYQRSSLLEQRRQLLQEWADYVTSLTEL